MTGIFIHSLSFMSTAFVLKEAVRLKLSKKLSAFNKVSRPARFLGMSLFFFHENIRNHFLIFSCYHVYQLKSRRPCVLGEKKGT